MQWFPQKHQWKLNLVNEGNLQGEKKKKKLRIHLGAGNKRVQQFTEISAMGMRGGSQDCCEVSRLSRSVLGHKVLLVSCSQITRRLAGGHLASTRKTDAEMSM